MIVFAALLTGCAKPADDYLQGYIEGEFVLLASPYAGQLEKLYVRRGETVERGKPVFALEQEAERAARREAEERLKTAQARLENLTLARRPAEIEALRAEVKQASAAWALSAAQLAQQEKLFKNGFISQARLDEARTALDRDAARLAESEAQLKNALQPVGRDAERKAAEAEVAAARAAVAQAAWRLEQKSVAAPVSGLVQDTFFREDEFVPAGRPVVSLLPPGNVKARFYVSETSLGAISTGKTVEIRCDGCPAPIAAKITFVSSQAEYTPPVLYSKESRAKLMFLVEARPDPADGGKLRPGQPVSVILR
ncbi:MAG: HlyD family efflux transporter periplasmic adaptor subunit [Betaproteobacteria bacterium]|nr:HlyD family efflux transporter periplasmic adaptor subunit [Betaproteobacteria bacterium]MBI2962059.1 HlyD family efflux transporter periplasmic adaptor subunit [Betaproteobacteria bacterium]